MGPLPEAANASLGALLVRSELEPGMGLQKPSVHRNGTARHDLVEQFTNAGSAVHKAIRAVEGSAPNARDYYLLGDTAFKRASAEYQDRIARLRSVADELEALAEYCGDWA